ncbi:MAG: amino acid ABC transporter permease [Proteobacteria bacterium]|nr:amino acid ABC transporter permease [Pseudomonadota bacterium]
MSKTFTKLGDWLKTNLFSSYANSFVSLVLILLVIWTLPPLLNWLLFSADFAGNTKEACDSGGACWVFIKVRLSQFIYGFYPTSELWRVNLSLIIVALGIFGSLSGKMGPKSWWLIITSTGIPLFVWLFLTGSLFGLTLVETSSWGGLLVTLVISFVGIAFSLPLGIILALARRSSMPVLKVLSTIFIESWRGVPLITVLFMSSVMFPIFLPEGWQIDKLLRALLGVLFFASAYMAEVIRGGLQAIPKGQYEASDALAMSYWQKQRFIILPQALKHVIPGIVNNFIALFKDTTLVSIIGMYDLLGIAKSAQSDPEWLGYTTEGYVFAGFVFWIFCFLMSRYSLSLEKDLTKNTH